MKIQYNQMYPHPPRIVELSDYLQPRYTGSTQGSIEQLEVELEVCKKTIGGILSVLVETNILSIDRAEDICGIHSSYREYRFPDRMLIP